MTTPENFPDGSPQQEPLVPAVAVHAGEQQYVVPAASTDSGSFMSDAPAGYAESVSAVVPDDPSPMYPEPDAGAGGGGGGGGAPVATETPSPFVDAGPTGMTPQEVLPEQPLQVDHLEELTKAQLAEQFDVSPTQPKAEMLKEVVHGHAVDTTGLEELTKAELAERFGLDASKTKDEMLAELAQPQPDEPAEENSTRRTRKR